MPIFADRSVRAGTTPAIAAAASDKLCCGGATASSPTALARQSSRLYARRTQTISPTERPNGV